MSNLIFIDDDTDLLEINQRYFSKEGHHVQIVSDPRKVVSIIKQNTHDCIILDIMMPGINGFELCRQIRECSSAPLIFLSGRITEQDKIKGLMAGGDDYLTKPYSFKELSARISAHTRRYSQMIQQHIYQLQGLTFDIDSHKVFFEGEDLCLSNKEFELLYLLATNPKRLITFEDIAIKLWGLYSESDKATIMVTASRLRKKLSSISDFDNPIESVRSKGYIFHMN